MVRKLPTSYRIWGDNFRNITYCVRYQFSWQITVCVSSVESSCVTELKDSMAMKGYNRYRSCAVCGVLYTRETNDIQDVRWNRIHGYIYTSRVEWCLSMENCRCNQRRYLLTSARRMPDAVLRRSEQSFLVTCWYFRTLHLPRCRRHICYRVPLCNVIRVLYPLQPDSCAKAMSYLTTKRFLGPAKHGRQLSLSSANEEATMHVEDVFDCPPTAFFCLASFAHVRCCSRNLDWSRDMSQEWRGGGGEGWRQRSQERIFDGIFDVIQAFALNNFRR